MRVAKTPSHRHPVDTLKAPRSEKQDLCLIVIYFHFLIAVKSELHSGSKVEIIAKFITRPGSCVGAQDDITLGLVCGF